MKKNFLYKLASIVKHNPFLWFYVISILNRLTFLLPHEKDYWGLKYFLKNKDGLLLDIGANNGMSALGFRKVKITYKIFSIEANPIHKKSLEKVRKQIKNFEFKIIGASDTNSKLKLHMPFYKKIPLHGLASADKNYVETALKRDFSNFYRKNIFFKSYDIDVIPLDNLDLSPDIIKVDVEGLDGKVLRGLKKTISKNRPVILVEFTPSIFSEIMDFFKNQKYDLFVFNVYDDKFKNFDYYEAFKSYEEKSLQINIFCVPNESNFSIPKI